MSGRASLKRRALSIVDRLHERRMAGKTVNPIPGYPVTYPYGAIDNRYPLGYHEGEDHAAPVGTPVRAVSPGVVVESSDTGGSWGTPYGKIVAIRFLNDEYRYGYCHLSRRYVNVGDRVETGQIIGKSGDTGNTTGPHLHFEARRPDFHYGSDCRPSLVKQRKVT